MGVHLITFKDMLQEHDSSSSSLLFSENIYSPDLEFSEAFNDARVPKRRLHEAHYLYKKQPNPKRIKFLPVSSARKRYSKLHQPKVTPE